MYEPETRPIWTNAQDEVYSPITDRFHTSNHATIWRWREAYQHDFAARIDWSNTPDYEDVNHPPLAKLAHGNEITVRSGEMVTLSAVGSSDPDKDQLQYHWFLYKEVGSLNVNKFKLDQPQEPVVKFEAPKTNTAKTMHFIVEVKDDGSPPASLQVCVYQF